MNKKLLIAAVGATLTVAGPSAYAIEGKVSGQVNRAVMMADDGVVSETHYVDNNNSGSRFRFTGAADMLTGVKAGVVYEVEFLSNSSSSVTNTPTGRSTTGNFTDRVMDVYFQTFLGQLTLGQGSGAADGGVEVDLSGTGVVNWSSGYLLGGGLTFTSGGVATAKTITGTTNSQDFESRYDRLRYDSPALGPVKIAVSKGVTTNGNVREASVWLNTDLGGAGKLAGAVGLSKEDTSDVNFDNETKGGSLSWLAPFGLNVTVATTSQDITTSRTGKFKYLKVGYKFGMHAVSVDHARGDDQNALDDEAQMMGVGYVFAPKSWADLYAGYKIYSLDRPGITYDDIKILSVGSRLKF